MCFSDWLKLEKGMTHKSAKDVVSRLNRVKNILEADDVSCVEIKKLEEKEMFQVLSMTVKSQLRRAIRLYSEFIRE
ncbi:MAG: hypothetical protein Q4C42_08995 [Clostridia bacterium]|nr:hypothetical protein [Clostridia bacterium]